MPRGAPHCLKLRTLPCLIAGMLWLALAPFSAGDENSDAFFETRIRPVLAGKCFKCHGDQKESAGLRVDSRERLLAGGESGAAIKPGQPDGSLLIEAIGYQGDIQMPPDGQLTAEVVNDFVLWVREGARWPNTVDPAGFNAGRHWAFQPIGSVEPPNDASGWSAHPIDRFIAAEWPSRGLKPVAQADKRVLLRRIYFDLIGLPPPAEEIEPFIADQSPDAIMKLIDRLLASPRYGERWGRYWMDVAHYADTAGDNADYPIPEARLYRDYIIDSFNADKPYDAFVQEQIAGDLLANQGPPEKYADRVVATGFLALSRRYGTAPKELWHLTIEDTIDTLGQSILGLTVRCARCHDHKFDPITIADYYALYGFFASTRYAYAGSEELKTKGWPRSGFVPLIPAAEAQPALDRFNAQIGAIEKQLAAAQSEGPLAQQLAALKQRMNEQTKLAGGGAEQTNEENDELAELKKEFDEKAKQQKKEIDSLTADLTKARRPGLPADLAGAYAVSDAEPIDVAIQERGEPAQSGPVVKRNVPKFLGGDAGISIPEGTSGRLQLAQWLTRPEHPLTARVMVNRIWQHHFGQGLVATPSNFGQRGSPPSHPELLDWLAQQFVRQGWSIKQMHRLIMTSKTYQLATAGDASNQALDPANRWYWRYNRRRLDADAIRDAMLSASGKLNLDLPGPHPFPAIDTWNWSQHSPFKEVYASDHRSVYLMTQRIARHPYLALFDGPDTNHSTDVRTSATVPLQALYLMNNPFVLDQARALAQRLIAHTQSASERARWGCLVTWGRPAGEMEIEHAVEYVARASEALRQTGVADSELPLEAWSSLAKILITSNEFLYVD